MSPEFESADEPYDVGDIIHIYSPEPEYEHRFGCKVVEVHNDDEPTPTVEDYSYTLYAYGIEKLLDSKYSHGHLVPSPRGYPNINDLLGETPIDAQ